MKRRSAVVMLGVDNKERRQKAGIVGDVVFACFWTDRGWKCGACHWGLLRPHMGATCRVCRARVVSVMRTKSHTSYEAYWGIEPQARGAK